jgi:hypothetical protein
MAGRLGTEVSAYPVRTDLFGFGILATRRLVSTAGRHGDPEALPMAQGQHDLPGLIRRKGLDQRQARRERIIGYD